MAEDLGFRFTWYGHSCIEVESEAGTRILFDPWFGNPRSPASADSVERCDVLLVSARPSRSPGLDARWHRVGRRAGHRAPHESDMAAHPRALSSGSAHRTWPVPRSSA